VVGAANGWRALTLFLFKSFYLLRTCLDELIVMTKLVVARLPEAFICLFFFFLFFCEGAPRPRRAREGGREPSMAMRLRRTRRGGVT